MEYDFNKLLAEKNIATNFSLLHVNSRSLFKNLDHLINYLSSRRFSVIAVSETWGNVNNEMFLNIPGYNRILVNRKTGTGGGVALFILNNLHFDVCADLNAFANDNFECVFVKLSSSTFKTKILGSVYRPSNSNLDLFMSGFESVLDNFNHFGVECLIAGDFNIDLLKY